METGPEEVRERGQERAEDLEQLTDTPLDDTGEDKARSPGTDESEASDKLENRFPDESDHAHQESG